MERSEDLVWKAIYGESPARVGGPAAAGGPDAPATAEASGGPFSNKRHISAVPARGVFPKRARNGESFEVQRAGNVLRVVGKAGWTSDGGGGPKDEITVWTRKSRREAFRTFSAVEWPEAMAFISLTYPGDISLSPKTGSEGQKHLGAFRRRWERRFGVFIGGWKREFQKRGSLHYHLWLRWPEGVTEADLSAWVHQAWHSIAGQGELAHLYYGAKVETWEGNPSRYVLKEMGVSSKLYQSEVPAWFTKPGRFWGLWGLKPDWQTVSEDYGEAVHVRRTVMRFIRSKGYRYRVRRGCDGVTGVFSERSTVDKLCGFVGGV